VIRGLAFLFSAALVVAAVAQEDSTTDDVDSFDIEPPLLIPNRGDEPLPDGTTPASPAASADVSQLEKNLERAERNAAGAERLYRIGALSKVETEQRALRVVRLKSDLENARLARAKEDVVQKGKQVAAGEIAKEELAEAETLLAHAIDAAHAAAIERERAELEAAKTNLQRQQKLLALGSARKSDVARAEQKLAELKTPKN
jgi:hypothetical protein